ncbi:hypothetical protein V8G54_004674, partial [Vigna mungo]
MFRQNLILKVYLSMKTQSLTLNYKTSIYLFFFYIDSMLIHVPFASKMEKRFQLQIEREKATSLRRKELTHKERLLLLTFHREENKYKERNEKNTWRSVSGA